MKERLLARWATIRKSKANVALLVVGCVLVVLSPVWAFAVAPWLKVEPTDFEHFYSYDVAITRYLSPPGGPVPGPAGFRTDAIMERRTFSRPDLSTQAISTVQVTTRLLERSTGQPLQSQTDQLFYLNRRKGTLMTGALSGLDQRAVTALSTAQRQQFLDALVKLCDTGAFYIVFPFNTPKGAVRVWDPELQAGHPAQYTRTTTRQGLSLYEFSLEYHNQKAARPAGFPERMSGAELKAVLQMPDLPVADTDTLTPGYLVSVKQTLLVEPRSGTIVEETLLNRSISLKVDLPGGSIATRLLQQTQYSEQPSSIGSAVSIAKDEAAKQRLQFTYIPLGLLLLGVACLLVGALAGVRMLREDDGTPYLDGGQTLSV